MHNFLVWIMRFKFLPTFAALWSDWVSVQDSSGIFWDNDSLAGLLALELKADLLLLLSDVEGLYSGPPGEPDSKVIHTYIKEIHETKITFGDKSRVGRGGMIAKVKAAACAASAGIPVVISRFALSLSLSLSLCPYSLPTPSRTLCVSWV